MTPESSPRILIARLSHIGDCILTIPVLNALRAKFPGAFLAWMVERPTDQLLEGHPALDELIAVPRGWMKSPQALWRLRRRLRSLRVDITVDPQSLTKSAFAAWLSGARQRLGLARPRGRELAPVLNTRLVQPRSQHVVDRSLELLGPLGINGPKACFALPVNADAQQRIAGFLREAHLGCGFAVVNPGAGWRSRQWSAVRFGAAARYLGQHRGLPSVVTWAGDAEQRQAEQIVASSGGHALMAPATDLLQLGELLRMARMYLGCDTGPLHLAAAVGTDCVALHGTTRPEISGPYGATHEAVQAHYQGGTSRQRRRARNDAMMAILVADVCEACDRVLDRQETTAERTAA